MTTPRTVVDYLRDILDAAEKAAQFTASGLSRIIFPVPAMGICHVIRL